MGTVESVDADGVPVSWYCTCCLAELGADDAAPAGDLGQPALVCPRCGSDALSWEPWAGEVKDGRYFPHDRFGNRDGAVRAAATWGG